MADKNIPGGFGRPGRGFDFIEFFVFEFFLKLHGGATKTEAEPMPT
jgi:hypothetical protein